MVGRHNLIIVPNHPLVYRDQAQFAPRALIGPFWDREADKREWNKRNAAPDLLLRLWATQFNVRDFQWPAAAQRAFNAISLTGLFGFFGS